MATQAQINASRQNSQKSTGPVTPEGKAKSCMNRLSHSFSSANIFIAFDQIHPATPIVLVQTHAELVKAQKERRESTIGFESQNAREPAQAPPTIPESGARQSAAAPLEPENGAETSNHPGFTPSRHLEVEIKAANLHPRPQPSSREVISPALVILGGYFACHAPYS